MDLRYRRGDTPIRLHAVTPIHRSPGSQILLSRDLVSPYHHALSALHHRQFHEAVARVEDLDGGLLVITGFGQQNVTDVSLRVAIVEREPA